MRTRVLYITCALVISGAMMIGGKKGFFLDLPGFFSWFLAAVTVAVVFVSIMIKKRPQQSPNLKDQRPEQTPADRREFPRIQHRLKQRPRLQIDNQALEVLDISERGLRFVNSAGLRLKNWVRGTLVFSNGNTISIDGVVARRQGDTVSLQLIATIPPEMIAGENKYHLSEPAG